MTLADRLAHGAPAGVTLRDETESDRSFIDALYASTRADEMAQVSWPADAVAAFLQSQAALQRAHYQEHYAGAWFLVVEREGQPIGRLYVHESPREARVMDIALLPDHRGRGIGSALVTALLAYARERGVAVTLHVEPGNPAQRLYRRLAFRLVEHRGVYDFLEWRPSRPLDQLTADDFEGASRADFTLHLDTGDTAPLTLDTVTRRDAPPGGGRPGFSLVFRSDSAAVWPQRIYRLEHPALGPLDVFLVPVGRGASGILYEAVFG